MKHVTSATLTRWILAAAVSVALVSAVGATLVHAQNAGLRWAKAAPFPEPEEELYGVEAGGRMYVIGGFGANGRPAPAMVYEYVSGKPEGGGLPDLAGKRDRRARRARNSGRVRDAVADLPAEAGSHVIEYPWLPALAGSNIAAMRPRFAAIVWLALAAPAFGQEPMTIAAALDEAVASNPELLALWREPASDRLAALVRASQILAEVRRAHAELGIARRTLELHLGQAPMLKEMADAAAIGPRAGEMARHDPSAMLLDIARLTSARVTAQEQVKIAELRLNAVLGRRLDAPVETLGMREAPVIPENAVEIALSRDPQLAAASNARRDAMATEIRRRVLEARARVDGARERAGIMTMTVLPQLAIAFDNARGAYTTNQGGFLEMLDAHHRQLEAGVENAARSADYERALVALDIAMGETPERLARAVGPDRREN